MIYNFDKNFFIKNLTKILFFFIVNFILSCASTEQFHHSSVDFTKSNKNLVTLHFKRTPVGFASGWNLCVIDYDIKEKPNGILARMNPTPAMLPAPLALLWAPDREEGHGTIALGARIVVYNPERQEGVLYSIPLQNSLPFGLIESTLRLPANFDEIEIPIENSEGRVLLKRVTVIGKTANKGTLTWKRPAGRFKLGVVYDNGWYFESPYIEVLSGEVKFVEFEMCCGWNMPSGSKYHISNIPFSD